MKWFKHRLNFGSESASTDDFYRQKSGKHAAEEPQIVKATFRSINEFDCINDVVTPTVLPPIRVRKSIQCQKIICPQKSQQSSEKIVAEHSLSKNEKQISNNGRKLEPLPKHICEFIVHNNRFRRRNYTNTVDCLTLNNGSFRSKCDESSVAVFVNQKKSEQENISNVNSEIIIIKQNNVQSKKNAFLYQVPATTKKPSQKLSISNEQLNKNASISVLNRSNDENQIEINEFTGQTISEPNKKRPSQSLDSIRSATKQETIDKFKQGILKLFTTSPKLNNSKKLETKNDNVKILTSNEIKLEHSEKFEVKTVNLQNSKKTAIKLDIKTNEKISSENSAILEEENRANKIAETSQLFKNKIDKSPKVKKIRILKQTKPAENTTIMKNPKALQLEYTEHLGPKSKPTVINNEPSAIAELKYKKRKEKLLKSASIESYVISDKEHSQNMIDIEQCSTIGPEINVPVPKKRSIVNIPPEQLQQEVPVAAVRRTIFQQQFNPMKNKETDSWDLVAYHRQQTNTIRDAVMVQGQSICIDNSADRIDDENVDEIIAVKPKTMREMRQNVISNEGNLDKQSVILNDERRCSDKSDTEA